MAARDLPLLRQHGWYLFAGANSSASNGLPIWRTWPTSTNAYAPAKSSDVAASRTSADAGGKRARSLIQVNADNLPVNLANLPQYPLPEAVCRKYFSSDNCPGANQNYFSAPDGEVFQSNGDIWIRNGGGQALFEADVLTRMLPPKGQFKQVPSFPAGSMVVEDGIPDLQNPKQLPVHFNPYIELVIHPVATNCRNCHQRAAWPRSNTGLSPSSAYQLSSGDPGLLTNLRPEDSIFKSLLLLDMQWAMADRAITSGTQATTSEK